LSVKRKWVAPAALWIIALALGLYAKAPEFPGVPRGKMLPRVPQLPPNIRELLFMLGVGSIVWYAVALALPFLLVAARRVDTERQKPARIAIVATSVVIALFTITALIEFVVIYGGAASRPSFVSYLPMALRQDLLAWVALAAFVAAYELRRRANRSRLERERLRAQIAEHRLVALTSQLHPHFLFNTLQGISTLIHRDPDAADEMLSKLSDLLRDLLRHRDTALISLDDELRFIRTYLEISKFRFADRLSFSIDAERDVGKTRVPLFILQPLVENALNHGIGKRAEGGNISVRAYKLKGRLRLEVEDNGGGIATVEPTDGVGLTNTRDRLQAMFGTDQSLSIESIATGGVIAKIDVPVR
jgi:signal transduction histidine kinase